MKPARFPLVVMSLLSGIAGALSAQSTPPVPPPTPIGLPPVAPSPPAPQLRPPYVPDELLIGLAEDPAVPATPGKTRDDLLVAMGATLVTTPGPAENPPSYLHVRLQPGRKLGRAFRTAQTFDFGHPARWRITYIEPNGIVFVAMVGAAPPGGNRLFNFSARAEVGSGEGVTIGGLVIPGEFARPVIFKVRGPSLAALGVARPLANPVLRIYEGDQLILQNDDWTTLRPWEKDYGPSPDHPLEPKIMTYLDPGIYTAVVSGADGGTGVALLETYLVDSFYVY